jgi:hypothetical protein
MIGDDPAIDVFGSAKVSKPWMPATFGAKTRFALLRGHDGGLKALSETLLSAPNNSHNIPSNQPYFALVEF